MSIMSIEIKTKLKEASDAYYNGVAIMSDFEYDMLYAQLEAIEGEAGADPDSPTQTVGANAAGTLVKAKHEYPCLSLNKTKDIEELKKFLGDQTGYLSIKCDGMTCQATYLDGRLQKVMTRGNGQIGEVLENKEFIKCLPETVPTLGKMVVRGEAIIAYPEFERINALLPETESLYKNPRNLVSGTLRQKDKTAVSGREVMFMAFELVHAEDTVDDVEFQMFDLEEMGFKTCPGVSVTKETLEEKIAWLTDKVKNDRIIPADGLVLTFKDKAYAKALGTTDKAPRGSMAFKWQDELVETKLREVIWSPSMLGTLTPVAVFEPVDLEGTTVSRASLHNVSIFRSLSLGVGDIVQVFKANMIIPQIHENLTRSGTIEVPDTCSACGGIAKIEGKETDMLVCQNEHCPAKRLGRFERFCSRDAFNFEGVSVSTLEVLLQKGFVKTFADLFEIRKHKDDIIEMDGFGEKSFENLVNTIDKRRQVDLAAFLYSLCIPNVGRDVSKRIADVCGEEGFGYLRSDTLNEFSFLGPVTHQSLATWFNDLKNCPDRLVELERLQDEVTVITKPATAKNGRLSGKTFVITGKLEHFRNRDEMVARIVSEGGKVSDSVNAKTTALINNDTTSASSKNKKAKSLGVTILSEKEFMNAYL